MNEIAEFKNELRNYLTYKTNYPKRIKELDEEIEYLYHTLSGMVGKGFGEVATNTNQAIKEEMRLNTLEKIEKLNKRKQYYKQQIDSIEEILNKSKYKSILIRVYCKGHTYERVGREVGYSARGLQKVVDRDLKRILCKG